MLKTIKLAFLDPNPYQPRLLKDETEELRRRNSIKEVGMLVPPLVRPHPLEAERYIVVDGQGRVDQARALGWTELTVDVREFTEKQAAEATIITNLQRQNFNPVESAIGYQTLIKKFNMTQQEVADLVGVSRSNIANSIGLLRLDFFILSAVLCGLLSQWRALAIGALPEGWCLWRLASLAIDWDFNVKEIRACVDDIIRGRLLISWRRVVPVAGLFNEDTFLKDDGEFMGSRICCYVDGYVVCGHESVKRAKAEGVESIEALVLFPTDLLRDPLPSRIVESKEGDEDALRVIIDPRRIIPTLSSEKLLKVKRHNEMLSGKSDQYPVLIVAHHIVGP